MAMNMCRLYLKFEATALNRRSGFTILSKFRRGSEVRHVQCIQTSCRRRDERGLKADAEMSWVRRILQGSGPSADVEETSAADEVVEVEPRYMEILQEAQSSFISRPQTRRKNYSPPPDAEEKLQELTGQVIPDFDPVNWKEQSLDDDLLKFKLLSQCAETFQHAVPSYQLRSMKRVGDVLRFYQTPVKDTTVFDELSTRDLPPNLRIQWDYNDSRLEVYEEYLDYVKKKNSRKPPDWTYRPSQ